MVICRRRCRLNVLKDYSASSIHDKKNYPNSMGISLPNF